jgi:hypothetical protein
MRLKIWNTKIKRELLTCFSKLWSWFSHKPVQYGINARGKNVPRKIEGITIVFYVATFFLACHAEVVGELDS